VLLSRIYSPRQSLKFYGLPLERPNDRHKWFFSSEEAEQFIVHRASKNHMRILQFDNGLAREDRRNWLKESTLRLLFRRNLKPRNLMAHSLWAVLAKESTTRENTAQENTVQENTDTIRHGN
jgi:hypothetical protein